MARKNITHIEFLRKKLEETDTDVLKEMLGLLTGLHINYIGSVECGERNIVLSISGSSQMLWEFTRQVYY